MANYVFDEVKLYGVKSYKCACGRRCTRRHKFFQTINPFNKNVKGEMKTAGEIDAENREMLRRWKAQVEACAHTDDLKK